MPAEQNPVELEKTPEYSRETLMMVEEIDSSLAYSQNLLGGLDRLAREQIIADQGIDPYKEIGRMDLEAKYGDAKVLEEADNRSRLRNVWRRLASNKYLKSETGLVDTRKLKEGIEGRKDILSPEELLGAAKLFGLNPNNSRDFAKIYARGEKGEGADKVILQRKTGQEIMEQWLKELENGAGDKLIKEKEGFDELESEIEKVKSGLPPESLYKLADEEAKKLIIMDRQQKDLNDKLNIFRQPLLEHQQDIASSLSDFSFLLKDLTAQEKTYQQEITNLDKAITGVKGSKELIKILGDDIKDWEEQKAQTQANLKDFNEKKEALNKRISELKTSQAEVDAALARINNIGKTKAEQAEAEQQKREEQRRQREAEREQRQREREQQRPGSGAQRPGIYGEGEEETAPAAGKSGPGQSRQAAASGKSSGKNQPPEKPAGPKLKSENNQPASAAETEQENKEHVVRRVSYWLNLLGLRNAVGPAKIAMENNFKADKNNFNLTASMTLGQVRQAYAKFIVDFQYDGQNYYLAKARKEAEAKLKRIINDLD